MKADAKANEATDKAEKERIEKLNGADSLIFQTEKQLKEYGDKIPADKKGAIESAIGQLKEAHKLQDVAAIDKATEAVNAAWTAASQDIYNAGNGAGGPQPGAQEGPGNNGNGKSGEAEFTDAEFEEVK